MIDRPKTVLNLNTAILSAKSAEEVNSLAEIGADLNAVGEDGKALIHTTKDVEVIKALILNGADLDLKMPVEKQILKTTVYYSRLEWEIDGKPEFHKEERDIAPLLIANGASLDGLSDPMKRIYKNRHEKGDFNSFKLDIPDMEETVSLAMLSKRGRGR